MRTKRIKAINGDEVRILLPESKEDEEELQRQVQAGLVEEVGSMQELEDNDIEDALGY